MKYAALILGAAVLVTAVVAVSMMLLAANPQVVTDLRAAIAIIGVVAGW